MIFEKELTDYHLEGEVSGEEESSTMIVRKMKKKKLYFGLVILTMMMKIWEGSILTHR